MLGITLRFAALKTRAAKRNITGEAIKRIRMSREPKITQDDIVARLARQGLTLSQAQVAKLENGGRPILDYELLAIARALKVPIQSLFE